MVELVGLLLMGGILVLVGTLGYQSYLYLKYGEWPEMSVIHACNDYFDVRWCQSPESWLGIHKMLAGVNVGLFTFLAAAAIVWLIVAIAEK